MTPRPFAFGSATWPGIFKLVEESGEVAQVCGKLIATGGLTDHWDGDGPLDERLLHELADLQAAIEFVVEANDLNRQRLGARRELKLARFRTWHRGEDI